MQKYVLLCLLAVFPINASFAQAPGAPAPKGTVLCTLTGSKIYKPAKNSRDIEHRIAAAFGAIRVTNNGIDFPKLEQKLRDQIGDKPIICKLTLRPSGQVDGVSILDSSGSPESDQKAVRLLQNIKQYGAYRESRELLSYQVELPNLYTFPLEPYGNKLYKRPMGSR